MKEVYITRLSKFFPNEPVSNKDMEQYLGLIKGKPSKARGIVLHNNGIKNRYYALDKEGKSTHSNAEMTALSVKKLLDDTFKENNIEVVACGTSSPDNLLPSHASMVHGELDSYAEVVSPSGACNAGMLAMKYAYMSVRSGCSENAICTGSEKFSNWLLSKNFDEEAQKLIELDKDPIVAFEKEFLRWMLSDGAGAALLQDKPNKNKLSLKIEWIENRSYANQLEPCMYAGGEKEEGKLDSWRDYGTKGIVNGSVLAIKQDVKLLSANIVRWGTHYLLDLYKKYHMSSNDIDFFLPHISSEYFRKRVYDYLVEKNEEIPEERWFTNLSKVGNVGAASIYLMLEELYNSGKLEKGQKLLIMNPESARFSYTYSLLTVV